LIKVVFSEVQSLLLMFMLDNIHNPHIESNEANIKQVREDYSYSISYCWILRWYFVCLHVVILPVAKIHCRCYRACSGYQVCCPVSV